MGSTKRTPIARHMRPQITARAVETYAAMKRLRPHSATPPAGPIATREAWYRLLMVVHVELRAKPWEIPCLADHDGDGSRADEARHARYVALERALKAQRQHQPAP
jgi:hypothetical protein